MWINDVKTTIPAVANMLGIPKFRMRTLGCPNCNAEHRSRSDPRGPVGVTTNQKGFKCWSCNATGDSVDFVSYKIIGCRLQDANDDQHKMVKHWFTRAGMIGDKRPNVIHVSDVPNGHEKRPERSPGDSGAGGPFAWSETLLTDTREALASDDGMPVQEYLHRVRKLSWDTIDHFQLGALLIRSNGKVIERWVSIPLFDTQNKLVSFRFRSVDGQCLRCEGNGCGSCKDGAVKKSFRVCAGRPLPLFGSQNLVDFNEPVIITEGEFDVMALHSYGVTTNVVSGTKGAAANWPDEWLDALEPFRSFSIAYDADQAGNDGAEKLAEKLGKYRCSRTRFAHKDANECLQKDVPWDDMKRAFDRSEPMVSAKFGKADRWAQDIETLINNPQSLIGLPTGNSKLDAVLGGIRPGLWVVTGDTGHGKTTFLTWLCWEQANRDVGVLVTSFEQRPIGTVQKLMRADLGGDFTSVSPTQRATSLDRISSLPLWILDHYGEMTADGVIESIRFANRRYGVRIALVDHLGFLVRGAGDRERQAIEDVVRKLALIGVNEGITILLVCHPNRTHVHHQARVKIGHLKGASAIEQDAHAGIVVERMGMNSERGFPATKIHIDKVRSEFGQPESSVTLAFDPLACVYCNTWEETPSALLGLTPVVG